MKNLTGLVIALLTVSSISGCAGMRDRIADIDIPIPSVPGVYRATIQQGNVVTQEMIDRLKPGMTRRQVRFILGEAVIRNTFRTERWDYVYTVQIGTQARQQQTLTVWFEDDALSYFEGDFLPTAAKEAQEQAAEDAARAEKG